MEVSKPALCPCYQLFISCTQIDIAFIGMKILGLSMFFFLLFLIVDPDLLHQEEVVVEEEGEEVEEEEDGEDG